MDKLEKGWLTDLREAGIDLDSNFGRKILEEAAAYCGKEKIGVLLVWPLFQLLHMQIDIIRYMADRHMD